MDKVATMMPKRRGHILFEIILSIVLIFVTMSAGYQMLNVLHRESKKTLLIAREQEMEVLARRVDQLVSPLRVNQFSACEMHFKHINSGDRGVIKQRGDRLIYQKNKRGYFVLCTRVKEVKIIKFVTGPFRVSIKFLDGSEGISEWPGTIG